MLRIAADPTKLCAAVDVAFRLRYHAMLVRGSSTDIVTARGLATLIRLHAATVTSNAQLRSHALVPRIRSMFQQLRGHVGACHLPALPSASACGSSQ